MTVSVLLTKADTLVLQQLLGSAVVKLLQLLDPALSKPSSLRSLLLELRPPGDLLRDKASRTILLELLRHQEASELCQRLGMRNVENPFTSLADLSVRRKSAKEQALFEFFGEPMPEEEATESLPPISMVTPGYPLFAHQRRAVAAVKRTLSSSSKRVLLHMPTGAGKTRTAMNVIADHFRDREPTLVVWLAYSEELCSQALEEFASAWQRIGNRELGIYRNWGDCNFELGDIRDGFLVAGLAKIYSQSMKSGEFITRLSDRTSLVVIDEAHQAMAETYNFILDYMVMRNGESALLGLSATPGRTWNNMDEDERLARFFCKQKVTLEVDGYANAVEFLMKEGYLARPNFTPFYYSGGTELTGRDLHDIESGLDIPAGVLKRLAEDEQRNLSIVLQTELLASRHRRVLVFATTVEHAEVLACVLRARGLKADAVTGGTDATARRRIIGKYCSNLEETLILCNYGVLTTGFDAPKTSAAVIARPTKSLVLYSQMVGRAIRGPRAGGNAEADIVTIVDQALPGFRDPGEAFMNWEDVWT